MIIVCFKSGDEAKDSRVGQGDRGRGPVANNGSGVLPAKIF